MQINVLQDLRQRVGAVSTYDIDRTTLRVQGTALDDLSGTATLLRTDRGLLVSIAAEGTMDERCSRCLAEARCVVSIAFEEEYVPEVDPSSGARVRTTEAEEVFRIGPDFVLDLREGLRQYVLMAEPVKPLCRTDCAGLCPNCGVDLNEGPCACAHERDARWGALALLSREKPEGS